MPTTRIPVEVDGRQLSLSNLDKILYPTTGFTKSEVIDYYVRIAPVLLPHLRDRPLTRKRYPDGVDGGEFPSDASEGGSSLRGPDRAARRLTSFYEKNAPSHTPDWVRTVLLPTPGSSKDRDEANFVVVESIATLVWLANLAALELHVPQWRVDDDGNPLGADQLVLDLDPGPPATIVECCQVALLLREELAAVGLQAWAKTSGSKGMQLYVPLEPVPWDRPHAYAKELAQRLEAARPDLVVHRMTRALRPGKVLVDWSQNNGAKTTVAPYSLRARPEHTVSTPVTWEEIEACRDPEDLRFRAGETLDRVEQYGDLLAPLLTERQGMPHR